jgi:nicotinate phosphoribosyltransferase
MKLSEQFFKRTIPGIQHILRFEDASGCPIGDMIVDDSVDSGCRTSMIDVMDPMLTHHLRGAEPREVLDEIVVGGCRTKDPDTLEVAKARAKDSLMRLAPSTKRFLNPQTYPVGLERGLADLRQRLATAELPDE